MVSHLSRNAIFFGGTGAMNRRHRGFTIIELMVVMVLGAALMSVAIKAFGATANHTSARQARNVFNGMASRARAHAIETGRTTVLIADARGDSVLILSNGQIVENVRFGEEMDVNIEAEDAVTLLCMNPRGYADQDCSSFDRTVKLSFVQGNESMSLEILPLGQIRW